MSRKKIIQTQECKVAVTFARVSSREQELGLSTDAQEKNVTNYCDFADIQIIKQYTITESSKKVDRKKFNEMLDFIKKQKRKVIIVADCIDRIQRSFNESIILDALIKNDEIELHFVREHLVIKKDSGATDITRWDFGVLTAKTYLGNLIDNVKRSQTQCRTIGQWHMLAPIGYLNIRRPDNKADIIVDEVRGPMIKRLFEEYAYKDHSLSSLTKLAKDMGLRSAKSKTNKHLRSSSIYDILIKSFYYGVMTINEQKFKHNYPPLITKEVFDIVQDKLSGKAGVRTKNPYASIPFAFRGLIRCKTCGCAMTPETKTKKNGKKYSYLKCNHLRGECKQLPVNENIIFKQLEDEVFKKLYIPKSLIEYLKSNVIENVEQQRSLNSNIKRNLMINLSKLDDKEKRLFDFYLDGNISKDVHDAKKLEIEAERTEIKNSIDKYTEIKADIYKSVEKIIDIASNICLLMEKSSPNQKRALLNLLIEDCYLDGKKLIYKLKQPFDKLIYKDLKYKGLELDNESLMEIQKTSDSLDKYIKNNMPHIDKTA